jgi:PhzF family phenazine biosynthesis protein
VQPQLSNAHKQGNFNVSQDFAIVSIVKGMTFVLIELESLEALGTIALAGKSLVVDGLDEGWDATFVGTYFFVRTGKSEGGVNSIRTRMIEGPLEDPATGSAASDLAAYLSLQDGRPGETLSYQITQGVEMGRRSEISVDVEMAQDRSISRVFLGGGAVEVMEGKLTV